MIIRRTGWRALLEWGLALCVAFFAVLASATIGMFVAPLALLGLLLAAWRDRAWPEAPIGGMIGAGAVCLVIAELNRHVGPCITRPLQRGEYSHCGGWNPLPWFALGVGLAALGIAGYAMFLHVTARGAPNRA